MNKSRYKYATYSLFCTLILLAGVLLVSTPKVEAQGILSPTPTIDTVIDYMDRITSNGQKFNGPWLLTYTPTTKGSSIRVTVPYVTLFSNGFIAFPIKDGKKTKIFYTTNWTLEPK